MLWATLCYGMLWYAQEKLEVEKTPKGIVRALEHSLAENSLTHCCSPADITCGGWQFARSMSDRTHEAHVLTPRHARLRARHSPWRCLPATSVLVPTPPRVPVLAARQWLRARTAQRHVP